MNRKLKVIFSKTGDMRFVSHLDLMRLFQRAIRRGALPVTMSQGFNPHLKISVTRALKLGVESLREEAVFQTDKEIPPGIFIETLNSKMPEGLHVSAAEYAGA